MDDPLLDKINKSILKVLRDDVVYDNLFKPSPFFDGLIHMPMVVRRQVNFGVPYAKAYAVYEEMIKAGTIEREPDAPKSWDGSILDHTLQEPFTYGTPKEIKE